MSKVKAKTSWVRISPRKLDRVVKLVRGMQAKEALQMLKLMPQKGAKILAKVIQSAIANAKHNYKLAEEGLVISEAFANKGMDLKRWQPVSRGRVHPILKRSSHLTVWLESKEAS